MDPDAHLAHYRAGGTALAAAAREGLDARVPSCPDWSVRDLVGHVGTVHAWVLACLAADVEHRPRVRDIADPPADQLVDWYLGVHGDLGDALAAADLDQVVPSWAGPVRIRWWLRRQAHEVTVHRWDGQLAHGEPQPIDAALAVDGIEEFLDVFVRRLGDKLAGSGETIHLHATDIDGEWLIERTRDGSQVTHGHAKGDVALRGTASDLLLVLWGRRDAGALEVFGDRSAFESWSANARI
jgi:uncharacterized protein (TIGR03083 family)